VHSDVKHKLPAKQHNLQHLDHEAKGLMHSQCRHSTLPANVVGNNEQQRMIALDNLLVSTPPPLLHLLSSRPPPLA